MNGNSDDIGTPGTADGQGQSTSVPAAHMRRVVAEAARGQCAPEELESAARALVHELRGANEPPEQMLLRIKEILAEAGLRPTYASDSPHPIGRDDALYRDVIMWSIRHYYAR